MDALSETISKPIDHAAAVNAVWEWVIAGNSEHHIIEAMHAKFPTLDHGAVMTAVMVKLRNAGDIEVDVVFGWCLDATRDLYRRMVEIGDFAGALRAIKQINEMTAKYVPNKRRDEEAEEDSNDESETVEPQIVEQ